MIVFYFVFFGLLGGVLGGMGMGGGTLLIPLLTIFLSIEQKIAQFTNLIVFLPMSIVAIIMHLKNNMIEKKGILFFIIPGIICSLIFSYIATLINSRILKVLFGSFLILIALFEIYSFFKKK